VSQTAAWLAAAPAWPWSVEAADYDRSAALTTAEQNALESLGWELRRWSHRWRDPGQGDWPALHRLVLPLASARDRLEVPEENDFQRRSAADAVALVLRGCATRRTSFWGWDAVAWAEILGPSRKAFQGRYPGWADSSARTYAIALAYVFGFTELNLLGNVGRAAVARQVFGSARVGDAVGQVTSVLRGWGHRSPQVTVRTESLVCHALLLNRSPLLQDLSAETLQELRGNMTIPYSLRQNVHSLHRALAALGFISPPPPPARLARPPVEGVAAAWDGWVQRWHDTSPLPPRGRKGRRNQMLRMGRWLAAEHPEIQEPGQWTRELCAAWVAAVDRLRIGDYIQSGDSLQGRLGEAGMAATHDLDQLAAIASVRGAVVRLLGDHRQLCAVESGGALRLLAHKAGAAELSTLYRFRDPAEAEATLKLRTGDAAGLDYYFEQGRVRSGSVQAMTEAAYAGWKADMLAGKTTLMAAATAANVTALAAQARADRVDAGQVEPTGITLHDGTLAGRGDWILTRRNNRTLAVNGSRDWVKNGDAWQVTSRNHDGSLRVRHLGHHGQLTLPASYVHTSVQLLYATTAHRAQGATVDTAHPLITPAMTRESLYVITSRARERTTLYTATHELLPLDEDERLDLAKTDPRSYAAREVLENVLAREGAELSATEAIRTSQQHVGSLATLAPRYLHAALLLATSRYQKAALTAFGEDAGRLLMADPAWGVVVSALHTAETQGWQPGQLLTAVVPTRELHTADSIGAVIAWRIQAHTSDRTPPPPLNQPTQADLQRYAALLPIVPALAHTSQDTTIAAHTPPSQTSPILSTHPDVSQRRLATYAIAVATALSTDEAQLIRHRAWPHLAATLAAADQAGRDLTQLLNHAQQATQTLPGDPISQLARTTRRLLHSRDLAGGSTTVPASLRYAQAVTITLGPQAAERARNETAWPALEAALRRAERAGHYPATLLKAAIQPPELHTIRSLSETLAWRIGHHLASQPGSATAASPRTPVRCATTPTWHTLTWTLKAAENYGAAAADILAQAAHAPDLATVLRIATKAAAQQQTQATHTPGLPPWITKQPPTPSSHDELDGYLRDAATLITTRVRTLALDAAQRRPAWTRDLGTPPADPAECTQWMHHLGIIAAYRDQYQTTTDDPHQILGPYTEPGHAGHTAYWHAAESVLTARQLAGLEPTDTATPDDRRVRAQLAADVYLALPDDERAAVQTAMIGRLGRAWFGKTNETDDHAVTRPAYSPHLAAVLTERGHLTSTPAQSGRAANEQPNEPDHHAKTGRPLEAAFAQRRAGKDSATGRRPAQTPNARHPRWPRQTVLAKTSQPQEAPLRRPQTPEPPPRTPTAR
jgi:hypothetical protein